MTEDTSELFRLGAGRDEDPSFDLRAALTVDAIEILDDNDTRSPAGSTPAPKVRAASLVASDVIPGTGIFEAEAGDGVASSAAAGFAAIAKSDASTATDAPFGMARDGTEGADTIAGGEGLDRLRGEDDDRLDGVQGRDTLRGDAGEDSLTSGASDDKLVGGIDADALHGGAGDDKLYGGEGDDRLEGSHGNDELRGDTGADVLNGGFGTDTPVGGEGDDVLSGAALGDLLFGSDGFDLLNGGYGNDRMNCGVGGDCFYRLSAAGHGSDWIQDCDATEGDVLLYGSEAARGDFQINTATTDGTGAADVEEAFFIHWPIGQIVWALVDGAGQDEVNLRIGHQVFDLMA